MSNCMNRQTKMIAVEFLRNLIAAVPYKLTHILTDHGIQFTNRQCNTITARIDNSWTRVCVVLKHVAQRGGHGEADAYRVTYGISL